MNLLVGNGLTTAVANAAGATPVDLSLGKFFEGKEEYAEVVNSTVERSAKLNHRTVANIEDAVRVVSELIRGLSVLDCPKVAESQFIQEAATVKDYWCDRRDEMLSQLFEGVMRSESEIRRSLMEDTDDSRTAKELLGSFLLTFANRTPTRDRLHVFTTNYDRLIEFGADMLGLRIVDRFVGEIEPRFRSSRLGVDLHYNPPGIRGEPRYLEGVVRFSKLHGSVDWFQEDSPSEPTRIVRRPVPFGRSSDKSVDPDGKLDQLIVYPNATKDAETLEYPYAEIFRDFAAAVCRPNAVLFTYGYGFGDDHINRMIRDMLTISSTHLVIISYSEADGRIPTFINQSVQEQQISYLIGSHFGSLTNLVKYYLPKPALELMTWNMASLMTKRKTPEPSEDSESLSKGTKEANT